MAKRTYPALERLRKVAESRGQKLPENIPRQPEPPPAPPVTPPVAKEPWVRSPLPPWMRPLSPRPDKPISASPSGEGQMPRINFKQRVTIFVGLLLEAAMLLFPPWHVPDWANTYRLFSSPPRWTVYATWSNGYKVFDTYQTTGTIDIQRLKFQCLIVAIVVIGFVVLLGGKKSKSVTRE